MTHWRPVWGVLQDVHPLERLTNKTLINRGVNRAPARPYRLSTMADYPSWASLTDKTYTARQLPAAPREAGTLPPEEDVAALFLRDGAMVPCPKSTVLFAYVAQWFTDGFLRSGRPRCPGEARDIKRNESSHEVDLMQLYGLTAEVTDALREKSGGRLKSTQIGGEEYPPRLCDGDGKVKPQFAALPRVVNPRTGAGITNTNLLAMGSDVGNLQVGYGMLTVLFLRAHNRIAGELEREHPSWDDERLFQTTRNILTVLLIKLVIEEYINHIAPYHFRFRFQPRSFYRARWYRPNWVAVEFNLLYRWHSLIPSTLRIAGEELTVEDTVKQTNRLLTDHGLGRLFEDASNQPAGKVCLFNTDAWLHGKTIPFSVTESRSVRLGSFNDYRADCGFPRVTEFNQITSSVRVRDALREAYGTVDAIELFVGLFAEDPRPNSVLPPLMGRLVGLHAFSQLMTNPLLAPAVYNERTFSARGMEIIDSTQSLEQLLNDNIPERGYTARLTRRDWVRA